MCSGLMVADAVVSPKKGSVPYRVLNPRNEEVNGSDRGSRRRPTCWSSY